MQLHNLQRKTKQKSKIRVGRGVTRGKTSGRGHKGQKARAGHHIRPDIRDRIKKIPKKRGFKFSAVSGRAVPVSLSALDASFNAGDAVSPQALVAKGLVEKVSGKTPAVKIVANGELTKKLAVSGCKISATAREQIEKAGGSISE